VRFQTKPELAIPMRKRIDEAGCPMAWVVADTVYGGKLDLRNWREAHVDHSVLAVACNEPVGILTPDGQRRRVEVSEVTALLLHEQDWPRLSMSAGTKGPRLFDWAYVPILHRGEDDRHHFLLIRPSLADPQEMRYYSVFAPPGTPLQERVQAIGARWHIEEDFEQAKDLGLDHYEVRSFLGWYRHVTLLMLAAAYLAGSCSEEKAHLLCVAKPATEPLTLLVLPLTVRCPCASCSDTSSGRLLATCHELEHGRDGADALQVEPATSTPHGG
jgi:SRSO17 transposase